MCYSSGDPGSWLTKYQKLRSLSVIKYTIPMTSFLWMLLSVKDLRFLTGMHGYVMSDPELLPN